MSLDLTASRVTHAHGLRMCIDMKKNYLAKWTQFMHSDTTYIIRILIKNNYVWEILVVFSLENQLKMYKNAFILEKILPNIKKRKKIYWRILIVFLEKNKIWPDIFFYLTTPSKTMCAQYILKPTKYIRPLELTKGLYGILQ